MFLHLLSFLRTASGRRWWFISIPSALGIFALWTGLVLLPQKPTRFIPETIPYIHLDFVTSCSNTHIKLNGPQWVAMDELLSKKTHIFFSRTGDTHFELIIDIYGLLKFEQNIFKGTSIVSDLFKDGIELGNLSSTDEQTLPSRVDHNCDELKIITTPFHDMKMKVTGEYWLKYSDKERKNATLFLRRNKLNTQNVTRNDLPKLFSDFYVEKGFKLDLPDTNSIDKPPELIAVRYGIDCDLCLRGNDSKTDIALSMNIVNRNVFRSTEDPLQSIPIIARANEQFIPITTEGGERVYQGLQVTIKNDLVSLPMGQGTALVSTWLDNDAERKTSARYTFGGVIIGLGLTLLVEAFIAVLYHLFHLRTIPPH